MSNFWWPALLRDVAQFVRLCSECQKRVSHGVADRVPLKPVRLIGVPFQDWQMDALGPELLRTRSGKRFCLTMVSRASRWISAIRQLPMVLCSNSVNWATKACIHGPVFGI